MFQPTVQILVHEELEKAKECAAAVLRNFSADPRTKLALPVWRYTGAIACAKNTVQYQKGEAARCGGSQWKHTDTMFRAKKRYTFRYDKRDAVGALRNLSTHDDCDEDIVRHGGIDFFISNLAEIIHQYETRWVPG